MPDARAPRPRNWSTQFTASSWKSGWSCDPYRVKRVRTRVRPRWWCRKAGCRMRRPIYLVGKPRAGAGLAICMPLAGRLIETDAAASILAGRGVRRGTWAISWPARNLMADL